jgi:hypothetical protein
MIRQALGDITSIRGDLRNPDRVQAWSEAVEALADLLEPWAAQDERFRSEWEARPMRVYRRRHASGDPERDRFVAWPTAQDCRSAQRVIMGLLDRAGILVKRRTVSGPRRPLEATVEGREAVEAGGGPEPLLGAL